MPRRGLALLLALALLPTARGQPPSSPAEEAPRLPFVALVPNADAASTSPSPISRNGRFRLAPGFLPDVRWLDGDTPPAPALPEEEPDWLSFSAGNDNPYFDLRKPGDPGGVGYARVHTHLALWENERTCLTLGIQAVTPLGLQADGLADRDGATVVSPALSLFHALEDGLALQAFVGKNLPLMNAAAQPVRRPLQYGFAVQQALSQEQGDPFNGLFLSVGALGQLDADHTQQRGLALDLLPSLQWNPADAWWFSAGYLVPVGGLRSDSISSWHLTCSWQY
ncbi:MAG: hypothetical protein U0840_19510 [Gemmataceae bacterium]